MALAREICFKLTRSNLIPNEGRTHPITMRLFPSPCPGGEAEHQDRWEDLRRTSDSQENGIIITQVGELPPKVQKKVQNMDTKDIPLADRRRLYNQLGRRLKNPDVPAGLLEHIFGASGQRPKTLRDAQTLHLRPKHDAWLLILQPKLAIRKAVEVSAYHIQSGPQY